MLRIYNLMPKKRKNPEYYFTQDTEDAIVLYNNTEDPEIRSKYI
jgi:hypothetical protein